MADASAGWYDDGSGTMRWWDGQRWTDKAQQSQQPQQPGGLAGAISRIGAEATAGARPRQAQSGMSYVVLQVVLKEKLLGSGSGNLTELEDVINSQAALGYRLHTISTASCGSKGLVGGDRIQATMVFERIT